MGHYDSGIWEDKADDNPGFAIAVALLVLAKAIHQLGNGDAATPMGAIEGLAAHIGEKIDDVAASLNEIARAVDTTE